MNLVSRSSFVVAALVASVFAAGPIAAQEIKGKLVLYTSQPERDASQTVAAFKRVQPGVEVEVFRRYLGVGSTRERYLIVTIPPMQADKLPPLRELVAGYATPQFKTGQPQP